jgi:primosomal protein N' (replication factor Y)
MIHHPIVKVALPVPLPRLFDYLQPEDGAPTPPGSRVLVPFGRRKMVGIVIGHAAQSEVPANKLHAIERTLDDAEPLFDARLLQLLRWCWKYYKHAPGDVVLSALPPALRNAEGKLPPPPVEYHITQQGHERLEQPAGRAKAQYRMLEALTVGPVSAESLSAQGGQWRKVLHRLMEEDWVHQQPASKQQPDFAPGPQLTAEQKNAVDRISSDINHFHCHLLDGVTGSGKTEVYMCLIERVLAKGKQALVLVPEIGLTPQLLRRFRNRLGVQPAVIHSGLSKGIRLESWADARAGRASLLVGTRSALFTPLPKAGLIILDEEHDASFKQQDGFRYSARDIAVKRAADLDIPVVLGTATPSLESLNNAINGRYAWHRLRQRATAASLPQWRVLDMRQQKTFHGLTQIALDSISDALERKEQVMVFLNRRGYAPVLMCQQCGWHGRCERCDSNMTWHKGARHLSCHHCGSRKRVPDLCPECRADALMGAGEGTQQLEEALSKQFPDTTVLRFDRDRIRGKGTMDRQLEQVMTGDPCILVGTQMLAKGHHFPKVTLVVIVNIDQAMYSADYRALERMGQMLQQVAGRAGRMDKTGTVILQTLHPDHAALELLLSEGYEAYARWLLEERQLAGLPPSTFQVLLRAEAHDRDHVRHFLQQALDGLPPGDATAHGPMPALMERVGGRSRMYLVVLCAKRSALHQQIDVWLEMLRSLPSGRKVRWAMDIDPSEL